MEKCATCLMDMRPGQEEASTQYQGNTYRFCSSECKQKFESRPKEFLKLAENDATRL